MILSGQMFGILGFLKIPKLTTSSTTASHPSRPCLQILPQHQSNNGLGIADKH